MAKPQASSLQAFLDDPGRRLRQTAYLITGSWPEADRALEAVMTGLLRRDTDFDDVTGTERRARQELVRRLRAARPEIDLVDDRHDDRDPTTHLVQALAELELEPRCAVVLAHFCHLPDAGVADAMGVDEPRAAALRDEAVGRLREVLAGMGDQLVLPGDDRGSAFARPERTSNTTVEDFRG